MAILKIREEGDESLRKICRPVDKITPRILTLLEDMTATMRNQNGCGLAAPQVGILRRIVVVEVNEGEVFELINPEIVASEGSQNEMEGCLSLPGQWGITERPEKVKIKALDRNGKEQIYEGSGLLARAFCHELDHLDGKLFKDSALRMLTEEEIEDLYSNE